LPITPSAARITDSSQIDRVGAESFMGPPHLVGMYV